MKHLFLRLVIGGWTIAMAMVASAGEILTLDSCLNLARQKNCTIQSAQLEVAASQELKKQVFTKYFPQVNMVASGFHALKPLVNIYWPGLFSDPELTEAMQEFIDEYNADPATENPLSSEINAMYWGASAGASLVQPVFMGGRIVNGNKLAQLGVDASRKKAEISERDVLQEVEDYYWLVAGLYEKRQTISQVNALLDTIDNVANVAFIHGLVTKNDLLKVQLKKNEMDTKSLQLENGIRLASKMLCQLINIPYEGELELESFGEVEEVEALVALDTFAIDGRPEAQLLDMNVQAEKLRKKMTVGEALPMVGIGLNGGYNNYFQRPRWNGLVFAVVRVPLTQWWETSYKIKQQNLRIQQAQLKREDLRIKLALQNEKTYSELNESIRLMIQQQAAMNMAQENYELSLMNYESGIATMSELLESYALLLQAQNAYTDSRINYRSSLRKFNDLNK